MKGVIVAGWADAGLHPQTFWLGYATGASLGWKNSGVSAEELSENFYKTFYRTENKDIKKIYQLTSEQAQFYEDSWEWGDSQWRTPIFGNHLEVYSNPKPALDQSLLQLPVPESAGLLLKYSWIDSNYKRLMLAQTFLKENDELMRLLNSDLSVLNNQYNIEVIRTVATMCRQNIIMLLNLKKINELMVSAAKEASVDPTMALQRIDQSLDLAVSVKEERNAVLDSAVRVWYRDWLPIVKEANGRKFLQAMDDVKDHRPIRTSDMSYLIYRELNYPMDEWFEKTLLSRNEFAQRHGLKTREISLDWKEYSRRPVH